MPLSDKTTDSIDALLRGNSGKISCKVFQSDVPEFAEVGGVCDAVVRHWAQEGMRGKDPSEGLQNKLANTAIFVSDHHRINNDKRGLAAAAIGYRGNVGRLKQELKDLHPKTINFEQKARALEESFSVLKSEMRDAKYEAEYSIYTRYRSMGYASYKLADRQEGLSGLTSDMIYYPTASSYFVSDINLNGETGHAFGFYSGVNGASFCDPNTSVYSFEDKMDMLSFCDGYFKIMKADCNYGTFDGASSRTWAFTKNGERDEDDGIVEHKGASPDHNAEIDFR